MPLLFFLILFCWCRGRFSEEKLVFATCIVFLNPVQYSVQWDPCHILESPHCLTPIPSSPANDWRCLGWLYIYLVCCLFIWLHRWRIRDDRLIQSFSRDGKSDEMLTCWKAKILKQWTDNIFEMINSLNAEMLRYWKTNVLKYWKTDKIKCWNTDLHKYWRAVLLKCWNSKMLKYWNIKLLKYWNAEI